MKHRTFFWFILPTAAAMLAFIALPIVSVVIQSLYTPHDQVFVVVENCDRVLAENPDMTPPEAARQAMHQAGRRKAADCAQDPAHRPVSKHALSAPPWLGRCRLGCAASADR